MNNIRHENRLQMARLSLEGLAMGDAYGNHHGSNTNKQQAHIWEYTDDTLMTLSIVENLRIYGEINQDALALSFANRRDGNRGYGQGVTRLLKRIQRGTNWQKASTNMFDGQGSYGNGSAMRVSPIGAYFADDLDKVIQQAKLSAEITHKHPEGVSGAMAVAVATAITIRDHASNRTHNWRDWLNEITTHTPAGEIHDKMERAQGLNGTPYEASKILGNGRPSIAQMTVPFALWCAGHYLSDYETAIRKTASVRGDVDTNCAIVGGIVIMKTGLDSIPKSWGDRRESLPQWAFETK